MKHRLTIILGVVLILAFVGLGLHNLISDKHNIKIRNVQLEDTIEKLKTIQSKQDTLKVQLDTILKEKNVNSDKVKKLEDENNQLQQEKIDLQKKLQAKIEAKKLAAQKFNDAARLSTPVYAAESDNFYKNYIYQHESGNDPSRVNSIGCRGLGQACPGTKLPCGADYACQDAYFTSYMKTRYGTWSNAYAFWVANHWW